MLVGIVFMNANKYYRVGNKVLVSVNFSRNTVIFGLRK